MRPNFNEIAFRFRILRGIHTFYEAAEKAGFAASDWHGWEKGKHVPTPRTIRKIAAAYGVDPEWILTGDGRGPAPRTIGPLVAEAAEPYGELNRGKRKLLKEVAGLLREADEAELKEIRDYVRLRQRAKGADKKRAQGED